MFEKSLNDLIRGIRAHPDDEAKFVSQCMEECRKELRETNVEVKTTAISKLTYLQMLGYDISWAAFNIVEVMSSKKFHHKMVGYLAACQAFRPDTDVLMLTTNLLKKDLASQNLYEAGLALTGLAMFVTPDLARDLANDVVLMMTSSRPYIRKKATLMTYKLFLRFPDALRPTFPRLKEKLEDADPAVQCAAVSVVCELARKNPKNYLSLAPVLFKILTESHSTWIRIKIIKLFAALTPLEPRLGRKLVEPLTSLIHSTPAMSLLYECIATIVVGIPDDLAAVQLCVQKLRIFVEDQDQNLKYLGLQALAHVLKIQPKFVAAQRDLILKCLDDPDESLRLKALDLLQGMVTRKTLADLVQRLLAHLEAAEGAAYRDVVLGKIVDVCAHDHYANVTSFEWYLQVLVQLTRVEGTRLGKVLAAQLMDVAIRVAAVRPTAARQCAALLANSHLQAGSTQKNGICEVLYAAAWVAGEFAAHLDDPAAVLEALLQPAAAALPAHIQAVYVHNALKVYAATARRAAAAPATADAAEPLLARLRDALLARLPLFVQSGDLEVQERAVMALELVKYVHKKREACVNLDAEVAELFDGELNPVAPKAQRKVPVPEGLDLDKWINEPPRDDADPLHGRELFSLDDHLGAAAGAAPFDLLQHSRDDDPETLAAKRAQRKAAQLANPFFIGSYTPGQAGGAAALVGSINVDDIPVTTLSVGVPITVEGAGAGGSGLPSAAAAIAALSPASGAAKLSKKDKKKLRKQGIAVPDSDDEAAPGPVVIRAGSEMPEGALDSDDDARPVDDPHRALNVNLDAPLDEADMVLPQPHHHVAKAVPAATPSKKEKKEKKDKKDKKEAPAAPVVVAAVPVAATAAAPAAASPDAKKSSKKDKKDKAAETPVAVTSPPPPPPAITPVPAPAVSTPTTDDAGKKKKKSKDKDADDAAGDDAGKKKKKSKDKDADPAAAAVPAVTADSIAFTPLFFRNMAADAALAVAMDTQAQPGAGNVVLAVLRFTNTSAASLGKLSLHIADTPGVRLLHAPATVVLPFELGSGKVKEHRLLFSVASVATSVKVKATVSYNAAGAGQQTLTVPLDLTCASFMIPAPCSPDTFRGLLAGGELSAPSSVKLHHRGKAFAPTLQAICALLHTSVVEVVDASASLYGRSTANTHFCFLVKFKEGSSRFSVDAKASDKAAADQLVALLQETFP